MSTLTNNHSNSSIDSYEIIDKIGRGKYSDVYKAIKINKEDKDSKLVVLKILKPSIQIFNLVR